MNKTERIKNVLIRFIALSMLISTYSTIGQSIKTINLESTLKYGEKTYQLTKGLEEVFKKDNNHSSSQINITNGDFYKTQVWISSNLNWIWRTRNASIWLYVDLYSPGFNGLTTGTYKFRRNNTDEDNPTLSRKYFFKKGKLAIDLNNNRKLDKGSEYLKITDGTISLSVSEDIYTLHFNITLSNDKKVSGDFKGDFDQV